MRHARIKRRAPGPLPSQGIQARGRQSMAPHSQGVRATASVLNAPPMRGAGPIMPAPALSRRLERSSPAGLSNSLQRHAPAVNAVRPLVSAAPSRPAKVLSSTRLIIDLRGYSVQAPNAPRFRVEHQTGGCRCTVQ